MLCFVLWCKCCYNTYSKLQYMICERDKIKNWQSLHFIYTFFLIVSIYGCFFLMFALLFVCIFCWQGFLLCIWIKQKCLRIYYIETPPPKKNTLEGRGYYIFLRLSTRIAFYQAEFWFCFNRTLIFHVQYTIMLIFYTYHSK